MPRRPIRQTLSLTMCLLAVVMALEPLGVARAADPVLTLEPDHGPCTSRVVVRGAAFPPGQAIQLSVGQTAPPNHQGVILRRPMVAADGTFAVEFEMRLIAGPCVPGQAVPDGTQFTFYAEADNGIPSRSTLLAMTVFTVSSSPTPLPGLPNTGDGGGQDRMLPISSLIAGGLVITLSGIVLGYVHARRHTEWLPALFRW